MPDSTPTTAAAGADFLLADHGSVCILTPLNDTARAWCRDNLSQAQWFGRGAAIEPRYLQPVLDGINCEGLTYTC